MAGASVSVNEEHEKEGRVQWNNWFALLKLNGDDPKHLSKM